jgi:hypothetical protein
MVEGAFRLNAGVYKFKIIYDPNESTDKIKLSVYKTQEEVKNTPPKKFSAVQKKKDVKEDSIIVKLNGPRLFQLDDTFGDEESVSYVVHSSLKELYFQDPVLGWIKVAEMFYTYPGSDNKDSVFYDHDEYNSDSFYGTFMPVKKSEFVPLDLADNIKFIRIKPATHKLMPVDKIVSLAYLNQTLSDNKLRLGEVCKTFNSKDLAKKVPLNKKTKTILKDLDGLSMDEILTTYKTYQSDVHKIGKHL